MELQLETLNGTPVFTVHEPAPALARVYGGAYHKEHKYWFFPAYAPFATLVLEDLKKVAPSIVYGAGVEAQITYQRNIAAAVEKREFPPLEFRTKPFDHQIEGLAFLYHHPRSALLWDPGTGKSKVIIDLARIERGKRRVLVLTPKVTVLNWLQEIQTHSGGDLRAAALVGTPSQKTKILQEHRNYDVLVASYGTARTMGLPKVQPKALSRLKELVAAGALSSNAAQTLGRSIRKVSDVVIQLQLIDAKVQGHPMSFIDEAVANLQKAMGPQWLEDMDYATIVADESHSIKDMRSQQTKSVLALSRKASRRHIMSGTPTMGNPTHLFPQLKFLAPCLVPEDWLQFSDKFLVRAKWNKRIVTGFKNLNILNGRVQRVAINKRKDECLDLPERTIIDVPIELSAEQKRLYNTLLDAMGIDLNSFFDGSPESRLEVQNAATLLNKLAQVSSGFVINTGQKEEICKGCEHLMTCVANNVLPFTRDCKKEQTPVNDIKLTKDNPKLEALDGLLDTLLENEENKVIIWAVYHAEMNMLEELLEKKVGKGGWVRVDGKTGAQIQNHINTFNQNPKVRVYLGQIATGVGITLNAASYMIYYNLDWSLGTYLQSIDRNYRAGQTKKVTVYRLLAKDTVDDYKAIAIDEKKDIGALLTSKLACATCPQRVKCLKQGIELFDPDCIHKRAAKRTVARPETLT